MRHHRLLHEEGFRVELLGGGAGARRPVAVRFYRPDGRLLPEVPASLPVSDDPAGELVRAHAGRGIQPDEWTATPRWWGEALDINLALDMLRHPLRSE